MMEYHSKQYIFQGLMHRFYYNTEKKSFRMQKKMISLKLTLDWPIQYWGLIQNSITYRNCTSSIIIEGTFTNVQT